MNFDRLRQALIKKAIEGTLVPPSSNENAVNLYPISSRGVPFSVPPKWQWVPLKVLCTQIATGPFGSLIHKTDYVENGIPIVNPANMSGGRINLQKIMQVDRQRESDLINYRLKENDIVIARRGDLGRCALVTKQEQGFLCGTGSFFIHLNQNILPEFFLIFFSSETARSLLLGSSIGTTMPNLNHSILKNFLIPLPPIGEQHRIVARLNELLAVIKQTEDAYTDLQSLGKTLRERIIQKAIEGKLVPQLDAEPVVKQIGEIPNKAPFAIPQKWKWRQLRMLVAKRRTIDPSSLTEDNVQLLSIPAYDNNRAEIINPAEIGSSKKLVFANDLLVSKIVPHISRAWIVPASPLPSLASTEWIVFSSEGFHPDYLRMIFVSGWFREKMLSTVSGMGSLKRANPSQVCKEFIPVPPLAEQRRIVAKLNELLPLVDQMTAV